MADTKSDQEDRKRIYSHKWTKKFLERKIDRERERHREKNERERVCEKEKEK
jgi:hypothetical protein